MTAFQDMLGSLDGSGMSEEQRDRAARDLATKCGYAAAAMTLIPIPLTEVVAVMPIHVGMVMGIGNIYGARIDRSTATQLILRIGGAVGLSYVGTELAITAGKLLIPFLGSVLAGLAGAPLKFASTIALGAVARAYFKSQGQLSDDEIKSLYRESAQRARSEYDPARAGSADARELAQAAVQEAERQAPAAAPPAPSPAPADPVARLERLKALLDKGLIEQDEYDAVKRQILDDI